MNIKVNFICANLKKGENMRDCNVQKHFIPVAMWTTEMEALQYVPLRNLDFSQSYHKTVIIEIHQVR